MPLLLVAVSGCTQRTAGDWARFGLPPGITDRAEHTLSLWRGAWIAALAIGVVVWGLIIWSVIRYRKRSEDVPVQTRYHMPIETLFTVVPFIMISVMFFFTVRDQNAILEVDDKNPPEQVVHVVGQQWSWTFNYKGSDPEATDDEVVWESGTPRDLPDLYLPVGEKVRFELTTPDVVHSFFIPEFLFKMDVFPGHTNSFEVTPTTTGTFAGKCAELCGTYHSRMLFNVHVVEPAEFEQHLDDLRKAGQVGEVTGGEKSKKPAGLHEGESGTDTAARTEEEGSQEGNE